MMKEKLKTAATAAGSAMKAKMDRSAANKTTPTDADMEIVHQILENWGSMPRNSAEKTIEKYGAPQEAIPSRLIWYHNGPWKRTIVYRDEVPHNFPMPHTDVIENVINYKIDTDKYDDLGKFDGSLYVDRTRGEASARCDMEAANMVSLNLMHDILTDKYTVEEARKQYGEIMSAHMMDRKAPYAERLQFEIPTGNTADQDEAEIAGAMMDQIGKKMDDRFN